MVDHAEDPPESEPEPRRAVPPDVTGARDAEEAVKALALPLLREMESREAGVRRAVVRDLHRFRVALRRTRTLLSEARDAFPPAVHAHFRDELRWLGRESGTARDLDVFAAALPTYAAGHPRGLRADLDALGAWIEGRRRAERERLARVLAGERYETVVGEWRAWLVGATALDATLAGAGPDARLAARPVARDLVLRAYRRVARRGRQLWKLGASAPREDVHELRIAGKKLRYLLELFGPLFEQEGVARLVRELEGLQDHLGAFHDAEIQIAVLDEAARELSLGAPARPRAVMAIGHLAGRLEASQLAERDAVLDAARAFARKKVRRRLERVLA